MRHMDAPHLERPFAGARLLRDLLRREGQAVDPTARRHADGAHGHRRPVPQAQHQPQASAASVHPYRLRGPAITRPNQIWAMDITYISMARGFVYLAAIIDWYSRRVLAHRVSISMDVDFCREAVDEAIARYGTPKIFNTDQGSSPAPNSPGYCSTTGSPSAWTARAADATTSLGNFRWSSSSSALWKSIKYEEGAA